jgi:hypothetical protein
MKKADIEIGKDYAYQYRRNDTDSVHGIARATVTGFGSSWGGAVMVEISIHRTRWEYEYDTDYKRIEGSEKRVEYTEPRKVALLTIVGEYEQEKARREAFAIQRTAEMKEYERLREIRKQWKADNYDPAMKELRAELAIITGKSYISEDTRLNEFDIDQIKAITEALRKVMVSA